MPRIRDAGTDVTGLSFVNGRGRRGRALVAFMFRSPSVPGFDHRDTGQHKRLLAEAFAHGAWRVPELLRAMHATDDLYFDAVSLVRLSTWSRFRIALLGDAASCVSLFGDGSTLAMAGAFSLADELAASAGDHRLAFRRYEARHRTLVDPKQRNLPRATGLLVPATRTGIFARNLATRLWPVATVTQRLRRGHGPSNGPPGTPVRPGAAARPARQAPPSR